MARHLIPQLPDVHICTDRHLPAHLIGKVVSAAIEERGDNLVPPAPHTPHGVMLMHAMAATPHPVRMAVVTKKLWKPGRVLKVKYLRKPSAHIADRLEHYAKSWSDYADIAFEFVANGSADLRITFDPASGSWSYIGVEAKVIRAAEATMNFGWLTDTTPEDEFSRVVLHEFGHALGCIHEHSRPGDDIPWKKPAVYEYYRRTNGWSKAEVDAQVFATYAANQLNGSIYDPKSIMHYAVPAELLQPGATPVGWNRVLSATDKKFIRAQYPGAAPSAAAKKSAAKRATAQRP